MGPTREWQERMMIAIGKTTRLTTPRQVRYYLRNRHFYSQFMKWGKGGHSLRRKFNNLLSSSVHTIVMEHLKDNMKAPFNNPAKPALFAPSSFNIYFGDNIGPPVKRGRQIVRAAYATNSGASSIGLDPRHATLNYMFPALSNLRDMVRERVKKHFASSLPNINCDFNHVSVKVYFKGNKTKEHTDIEFNRKHTEPKVGNSQVPSTPVVMVSLGDDKYLHFSEYWGEGKGVKVSPQKSKKFLQQSRSMFILDPRDEELNDKCTFWKHKSDQINKHDEVTITLMFRVVQATVLVHSDNGLLVNPKVPGTGVKKKQFDKGWKTIKNDCTYSGKRDTIVKGIQSTIAKYY